jgi:hypothetical protein
VVPKEEKKQETTNAQLPAIAKVMDAPPPAQLSPWEAFEVALHQFLPLEVPMGAKWQPASAPVKPRLQLWRWSATLPFYVPPTTYATVFLRIAGSILVTLGIAALTGLLRRVAP